MLSRIFFRSYIFIESGFVQSLFVLSRLFFTEDTCIESGFVQSLFVLSRLFFYGRYLY